MKHHVISLPTWFAADGEAVYDHETGVMNCMEKSRSRQVLRLHQWANSVKMTAVVSR